MKKVLYPGSFDPITFGHLDIIKRSAALFDGVVVAVLINTSKRGLFTAEQRVECIQEACKVMPNVKVVAFSGLLIDFAAENDISAVIKGVRSAADMENEKAQARANAALMPGLETLLLPSSPEYEHISSSLVREVAWLGGDVSRFVPAFVAERLQDLFHRNQ